jgi:hypothetical protein
VFGTSPETSSFPIVTIAAVDIFVSIKVVSRLEELQDRRRFECRLTPDRALESLDEAEAFLHDRGLLTRTTDCALPSLYEACHEGPVAVGRRGFGEWPATKWRWASALAERPGVHLLKVHRGKNVFLTDETLALVDPICRSELERMHGADPAWRRLLDHLAAAGPSEPEDLRRELDLKGRGLKTLRYPLERCGAIVSRQVVHPTADGGHRHSSLLARWDQAYPEPSEEGGLADLLVAGVRAGVVAPEPDLERWFSWPWLFEDGLVDKLVAEGRLERPGPGWIAAG